MEGNTFESLFEAIDIIAAERVNGISFDKTIKCTITNTTNSDKGEYVVTDGTSTFLAYSDKPDYKENTAVFVLVPSGDFTQTKTILSKYVGSDTNEFYTYTSAFDRFLDMTGDIINSELLDDEFGLVANSKITPSQYELIPGEGSPQGYTIDCQTDLTGYEVMGIKADFKTYLADKDLITGDYGICVVIRGVDVSNPNKEIINKYYLSSKTDMYGDPYNYMTYYTQEQIFNISNFQTILDIKAYFYEGDDFENQEGIIVPDLINNQEQVNIYMRNPYIAFGFLTDKYEPETVMLYTVSDKENNISSSTEYTRRYNGSIVESSITTGEYGIINTLNSYNRKKLRVRWLHEVGGIDDKKLVVIDEKSEMPLTEDGVIDAKVHWYIYDEDWEGDPDPIAGDKWREAFSDYDNSIVAKLDKLIDSIQALEETYGDEIEINEFQRLISDYNLKYSTMLLNPTFELTIGDLITSYPYYNNFSELESYNSFIVNFTPNFFKEEQRVKVVIEHSIAQNYIEWAYEKCSYIGLLNKYITDTSKNSIDIATNCKDWYIKYQNFGFVASAIKQLKLDEQIIWNDTWLANDKTNSEILNDSLAVISYCNKILNKTTEIFLEAQQGSLINYYHSKVLVLKRDTIEDEVDLLEGLNIIVDPQDLKGVYNLYDESGMIISSSKATKKRPMYVYYDPPARNSNEEVYIASTVTWGFPVVNSMITAPMKGKEYPEELAEPEEDGNKYQAIYTRIPTELLTSPIFTTGETRYEKVEITTKLEEVNLIADLTAGITYYLKVDTNLIPILGEYKPAPSTYSAEYEYYKKIEDYNFIYSCALYTDEGDEESENKKYDEVKEGSKCIFGKNYYVKTVFNGKTYNKNKSIVYLTYRNVPIDKRFYVNQNFRIKNYYIPSAANNTITCQIDIAGIESIKPTETTLRFQGASTNGTNYSFTFWADRVALPVNTNKEQKMVLTPVCYNYNGDPYEIKWQDDNLDKTGVTEEKDFSIRWYSCPDKDWSSIYPLVKDKIKIVMTYNGAKSQTAYSYDVTPNDTFFNSINNLKAIVDTAKTKSGIDFTDLFKYGEDDKPSFVDCDFSASFGDEKVYFTFDADGNIVLTNSSNANHYDLEEINKFRCYNNAGKITTYGKTGYFTMIAKYLKEILITTAYIERLKNTLNLFSDDKSEIKTASATIATQWIKREGYIKALEAAMGKEGRKGTNIFTYQKVVDSKDGNYKFNANDLRMEQVSGTARDEYTNYYKVVTAEDDNKVALKYDLDAPFSTISAEIVPVYDDETGEWTGEKNVVLTLPQHAREVENYQYYILEAELKNQIEYAEGKVTNLTTLFPVCISNGDYANTIEHFDGCSKICYDSNGSNPKYYKESYKLYDSNYNEQKKDGIVSLTYDMGERTLDIDNLLKIGEESYLDEDKYLVLNPSLSSNLEDGYLKFNNIGINWQINLGSDCHESDGKSGYPKLTSNDVIQPLSMYLANNGIQIAATAYTSEGVALFSTPIIIYQDSYSMALINSWDGSLTIDEENGIILSTMLGAGKKDGYNRFEGVLMGDVGGTADKSASTGLFGYHEGVQSFGFRSDGTAFLGKSGSGRIVFDGNQGIIQSATYNLGTNFQGMQIDLDDGVIDIVGPGREVNKKIIRSKITLAPKDPYMTITSEVGHKILYIGTSKYYLESDNFKGNYNYETGVLTGSYSAGSLIDLKNGNVYLSGSIHIGSDDSLSIDTSATMNDYLKDLLQNKVAGWTIWHQDETDYGLVHISGSKVNHYMGNGLKDHSVNDHKDTWALYMNGNFGVTTNGNLYAKDGNFSGTITSTKGTIGGWTIASDNLYSVNNNKGTGLWKSGSGGYAIVVGYNAINNNLDKAPFRVTHDGKLYATGADISGDIKLDNLYLKNDDKYDLVTPKKVKIPVAFKAEAVGGYVETGTKTIWGKNTFTGSFYDGMSKFMGYNCPYPYVIGSYSFLQNVNTSVRYKIKATDKPGTYVDVPVHINYSQILGYNIGYFHNATYSKTYDVSMTVPNYSWQTLGYKASITKVVEAQVYMPRQSINADGSLKTTSVNVPLPQQDGVANANSYGIYKNGDTYLPSKEVTLFTTGPVVNKNVAIVGDTEVTMNMY